MVVTLPSNLHMFGMIKDIEIEEKIRGNFNCLECSVTNRKVRGSNPSGSNNHYSVGVILMGLL